MDCSWRYSVILPKSPPSKILWNFFISSERNASKLMKVDIFFTFIMMKTEKFQLFIIAVLEFGTGGQRICFNYWQLDPQTSNSHNPQFLHGHKTRFNLKGQLQFRLCKLKPMFPDFLQPAESEARMYLLEFPSLMFSLSAYQWTPSGPHIAHQDIRIAMITKQLPVENMNLFHLWYPALITIQSLSFAAIGIFRVPKT